MWVLETGAMFIPSEDLDMQTIMKLEDEECQKEVNSHLKRYELVLQKKTTAS